MISNIRNSLKRIEGHAIKTPLHLSERLSEKYDCEVYLKREDLQKTRSFKIRGSLNKIIKNYESLKTKEIVCASAGNHAQGVAFCCSLLNVKGKIFCPETTPPQKLKRIQHFGKNTIGLEQYGNNFNQCLEYAMNYSNETDGIFIHPFNDIDIIEGQGTVALEIWDEMKDIDILMGCLGGGGLMSGVGGFLKDRNIRLYGVEPKGAESMRLSLNKGEIVSMGSVDNFVDGASVGKVGDLTFKMCREYLDDIFVVDNGRICNEMLELYQEDGIIVEPAGCLSICGLDSIKDLKGKRVVCIVSGGNNDIMRYPEILEKNSIYLGVKHYYIVEFSQKPMELRRFIEYVLDEGDDITRFEYIKKTNKTYGEVLVGFESNNIKRLEKKMNLRGFNFKKISENDLIFSYLI